MKCFPLVWAALRRKKPVRLTLLLSVVVVFFLFDMMAGLKASFDHFADATRADRIYVNARFVGGALPSIRAVRLPVATTIRAT